MKLKRLVDGKLGIEASAEDMSSYGPNILRYIGPLTKIGPPHVGITTDEDYINICAEFARTSRWTSRSFWCEIVSKGIDLIPDFKERYCVLRNKSESSVKWP